LDTDSRSSVWPQSHKSCDGWDPSEPYFEGAWNQRQAGSANDVRLD
jgi:hypothetical protein